MNSSHPGTQALVKLLAIVGFFAVLALGAWLLIQGVRLFPTVFSSLASIAETVNTYGSNRELTVELGKNIVNSGETFAVNWTEMGKGSYTFSYACTDGVSLSVKTDAGLLRDISCTDSLSLPEEVHGLFLSVSSKEQRFSDVPFTVRFEGTRGDDHVADGTVTVVNATVATKAPEVTAEIPLPEKSDEPVKQPEPVKPVTPAVVTPPPTQPKPTQPAATAISILPTSYENGFTDLRASYLGVGAIENGVFVPKATFTKGEKAAFKFEVKNIGTKTSSDWTYAFALPNALDYTSDSQIGLKPNERAIFTVEFVFPETKENAVTLTGTVKTSKDTNEKNNTFSWSVKVGS